MISCRSSRAGRLRCFASWGERRRHPRGGQTGFVFTEQHSYRIVWRG
jgi:hypothetical protein